MMMHMPWVLVTLMVFLVLVAGGAFLAVRMLAASSEKDEHRH